jgi:hypothetical protein
VDVCDDVKEYSPSKPRSTPKSFPDITSKSHSVDF